MPCASILQYTPLVPQLSRFRTVRNDMKKTSQRILTHIRSLNERGELTAPFARNLLKLQEDANLSEDDMLSEIQLIFIAGHETTAHTLSWFFFSLASNPDVQSRAHCAMDAAPSSSETSQQLPAYVEAVLKESMRRYPVVANGSLRYVREDEGFSLKYSEATPATAAAAAMKQAAGAAVAEGMKQPSPADVEDSESKEEFLAEEAVFPLAEAPVSPDVINIPKGAYVLVNFNALHNSSDAWGPHPLDFDPSRWMPTPSAEPEQDSPSASPSSSKKAQQARQQQLNPLASISAYAGVGKTPGALSFAPFSFGPRSCLGMNLALMELRMTIAALLPRFTFSLADPSMADDPQTVQNLFTLRPAKFLPMVVKKRAAVPIKINKLTAEADARGSRDGGDVFREPESIAEDSEGEVE